MDYRQPQMEAGRAPFDTQLLHRLMAEADMEVLVACSRHNTRYLLGGYEFFFFASFDPIGVSRYLPLVVYFRGQPERTVYIGNGMEQMEFELGRLWTPTVGLSSWGTRDAMSAAIACIRRINPCVSSIGVEAGFLPHDAAVDLVQAFPAARISDAHRALESLRAVKRPDELRLLRTASEGVVEAMAAAVTVHGPGSTKNELVESLRREQVARGLRFEYCLISAGKSLNRSPSDEVIEAGDIISVDSGGSYGGYIGDLCRMAVMGEPDPELRGLLAEVDSIQQAARSAVRPGAKGRTIYEAATARIAASPHKSCVDFVAHGMGLISHEAPRLTRDGPIPYDAADANAPLLPGMVLSIETSIRHPCRGFIKLEDTVAVTDVSFEAFGDRHRGWIRAGRPVA